MNLGEIRQEVQLLAPQPDFDDDKYNEYINEAVLDVADEIIIPDLKRIDSVRTDPLGVNQYVTVTTLSGGFGGVLRRVRNTTTDRPVHIFAKLEQLFDRYREWQTEITIQNSPGNFTTTVTPMHGDVEEVALEGYTLWYMKVPDGVNQPQQTLLLLYTSNPPPLVLDSDEPIYPSNLQRRLLVNGAAWKIWDTIETDIEQPKVQTAANRLMYEDGITKYREHIARRTRHVITSCWRY